MNVIAWLEYELAYNDSAVHRFNRYTTGTPPEKLKSHDIFLTLISQYHYYYWKTCLGRYLKDYLLVQSFFRWPPPTKTKENKTKQKMTNINGFVLETIVCLFLFYQSPASSQHSANFLFLVFGCLITTIVEKKLCEPRSNSGRGCLLFK